MAVLPACAPGQQGSAAGAGDALQFQLQQIVSAHHGTVALYAKNLATGETVGVDENKPVQTASVIKLTILFDAMEQVRSGTVKLSDPVVLRKEDQVGGSGILQLFDTPLPLTFRDVLMFMITQSDNTATNLAIDKLGLSNINAETQKLGLHNTWLYKKVFKPATEPMPADQKVYGLGKSTPFEMTTLLARIYHCEFTTPRQPGDLELCNTMLGMLQKQAFRDGLPRYLERDNSAAADAAIGNKTGSLDAARSDVGIVATKAGPIVMAIFTYNNADKSWYSDTEGELTIAKIAQAVVKTWSPAGLDPQRYTADAGPVQEGKH
jgi:beta-lactamase class A